MNIALLSHEYPEETGFGGIGTYTWYHARALARLGHEVFVLAGAASSGRRTEEHDGVRVWRRRGEVSRGWYAQLGRLRWWWTRERLRNTIDMLAALRELERSVALDVIESPECGAEGALANLATRTPTVTRLHSPARLIMPFYDVKRGDMFACSAVEAVGILSATALTSTSRYLKGLVRERLHVKRDTVVVPNGIDVGWFDATAQVDVRTRFGIAHQRPVILFLGRLERRKGIHLCPEVVTKILSRYDASFVFAGDDLFGYGDRVLKPALEGIALRGSMHLLGRLSIIDVRSLVMQADIIFLPSLWESCPYSCLEAMAAGRAIVCSDAGGIPEILTDRQNALVVSSGDSSGFAAAIGELIEDIGLRDRLGNAARNTVTTRFTDTGSALRMLEVYGALRD